MSAVMRLLTGCRDLFLRMTNRLVGDLEAEEARFGARVAEVKQQLATIEARRSQRMAEDAQQRFVWLVVGPSGIARALIDNPELALRDAKVNQDVVCAVPIIRDYRPTASDINMDVLRGRPPKIVAEEQQYWTPFVWELWEVSGMAEHLPVDIHNAVTPHAHHELAHRGWMKTFHCLTCDLVLWPKAGGS